MIDAEHTGPGHADVTLTLSMPTRDGGRHHRSWTVCECSLLLSRIEPALGPPRYETVATAEAYHATAAAVMNVPGAIHTGPGFDRG
jgi:hypothetical protein